MLIHHTKPREDLNDGKPHEPRKVTALQIELALRRVRERGAIRTLKVPK